MLFAELGVKQVGSILVDALARADYKLNSSGNDEHSKVPPLANLR